MSKPLSADEELKQHCDNLCVPSLWYDRLIEIVQADRKKHELRARTKELQLLDDTLGALKSIDEGYHHYLLRRLAELKQELEKL